MNPEPLLKLDTLETLYRSHHGWLQAWLRRRVRCSEQAADVAQDTFVRLLTAGDSAPPEQPRAYLATIAKRLLINMARRKRLEQAYLEELAAAVATTAQAPSPQDIVEVLEALYAIDAALAQMKWRAREAFKLRHLAGLGQAEIAVRLGVTVRTVQNYLVEAMLLCDASAQP